MRTARETFFLKEEERRRAWAGAGLFLAGLGGFALLAAVVAFQVNGDGPAPPELLRPFWAFLVVVLLLLGAGLYTRLRPRHFVAVDAAEGRVTLFRDGRVRREMPLSEIGPLRHALEERREKRGKSTVTVLYHVARSGPLNELRVYESEDELATRRALEAHARAWNLPYVKPTGETRSPEELDVPLYQRLGSDETATKPLPQRAGSGLSVAWKDDGYEVTTTYRPRTDRVKLLLLFLGPAVLVGFLFREPLRDAFRPEAPVALRVVGGLVALLLFVPGAVTAAKAWLRSSHPPVLRISAEGVRFRGRTLPLRSIEEVERVPHAVCRLVSDTRIVEIGGDFCEASEREWLHHEIRRLVVEVGQRTPVP